MNPWITEGILRGLALSSSLEVVCRIAALQGDKLKGFVKQVGPEE